MVGRQRSKLEHRNQLRSRSGDGQCSRPQASHIPSPWVPLTRDKETSSKVALSANPVPTSLHQRGPCKPPTHGSRSAPKPTAQDDIDARTHQTLVCFVVFLQYVFGFIGLLRNGLAETSSLNNINISSANMSKIKARNRLGLEMFPKGLLAAGLRQIFRF